MCHLLTSELILRVEVLFSFRSYMYIGVENKSRGGDEKHFSVDVWRCRVHYALSII